jgi:putative ABC transport system substrate-binding protein
MTMRRRDFITLLGGAAVAWPLAARAQQPGLPVIGMLDPGDPEPTRVAAFLKGLGETGFIEGRNVAIEYRWAHNESDRLPELAADLVRRRVAIIAAWASAAALAAKATTSTIPIVFTSGIDPVQLGLVSSLNRPGGNITGTASMATGVAAKRLDVLHRLVPRATRIAVLSVPNSPSMEPTIADLHTAAATLGLQIEPAYAGSVQEIDAAFARLAQMRTEAVLVNPSPAQLFLNRRVQLALLAVRHMLPVMYSSRVYVEAGGLISYGADGLDTARQVGNYAGRILHGDNPADLPVTISTKFELVINQTAARTIGLEIPSMQLALADDVIE